MKLINAIVTILMIFFLTTICSAEEKILMEGKGFRNLIIGELCVNDVTQLIGEPDSIETPREWSLNHIYSSLGLKINYHNGTLNTISALPNFDGKTSKGITLQSSLDDIEAAYGEPIVAPKRTKDNAKVWAYDQEVIFWLKRSKFLKRFQGIEKIVIYNNSWRWKEKKK